MNEKTTYWPAFGLQCLLALVICCLAGCTTFAPKPTTSSAPTPDSSYGTTEWNSGDYGPFIGRDGKEYRAFGTRWHELHPLCPGVLTTITWNGKRIQVWAVLDDVLVNFYSGAL